MEDQQIKQFSDGIRMIMICQRRKEGGRLSKTDRISYRKISTNTEEFFRILKEFRTIKEKSDLPLRIYSCVNKRDINKAIMNFKRVQLEADFYDEESKNKFYFDVKNRWISSLMKPNARAETMFLIDSDDPIKPYSVLDRLKILSVKVILQYRTKNGWHFITEPFNPNKWAKDFGEIKKDALLLLDY